MEPYFLVLEIHDENAIIEQDAESENICANAALAITNGNASIICVRNDTGISEELRTYARKLKKYTTFILLQVNASKGELLNSSSLLKKVYAWLKSACHTEVVHTEETYRLIAVG